MTHDPRVQTGNEVTESVTSGTAPTPNHDPLCLALNDEGFSVAYVGPAGSSDHIACISCHLIAKVRADEAPKAVTRWIEQGASFDDWMKVWQVRDYAEALESKVRADTLDEVREAVQLAAQEAAFTPSMEGLFDAVGLIDGLSAVAGMGADERA